MLNSEARERVLEAAEQLFAEKGYAAVRLKDVAEAAGIRHATLYHHVPGGKEALYVEVTERALERHRRGLTEAISAYHGDLRAQLIAVADWLLSHPPVDFVRMRQSDMPTIDAGTAARLSQMALDALIAPIAVAFAEAGERGELASADLGLAAGGAFGLIESMHLLPPDGYGRNRRQMVVELIDMFLYGVVKH
jgi:AcrR family transcriptional regulator